MECDCHDRDYLNATPTSSESSWGNPFIWLSRRCRSANPISAAPLSKLALLVWLAVLAANVRPELSSSDRRIGDAAIAMDIRLGT